MPITLLSAQQETHSIAGSVVETADAAATLGLNTDFAGTIQLVISKGTPASNAFSAAARPARIVATLDLVTGQWSASNGTSGQLSAGALNSFKTNTLVPLRNQVETFVLNNILPGGSQVSWT